MKNLFRICLLTLILFAFSCEKGTESDLNSSNTDELSGVDAKSNTKQTADIFDVFKGVMAGTSTLHRNNNGITMNFKATGLIPGHAYTVWWVIWNNPDECQFGPGACGTPLDFENADDVKIELMYAAGHVAGGSGKGNFSGHLNENDASETINPLFFLPSYGGLLDAQKAEVHLVLRSHGPKVPGIVNEQIGSYLGGCPTDFPYGFPPFFMEIPDEVGECGDIYASIHQP